MKTSKIFILLITALLCQSLVAKAQNDKLYSTLDKFSNTTWVWTDGTDSLKIYLKKAVIKTPRDNGPGTEGLMGFHYFKKGNTVEENSFVDRSTFFGEYKWTILLGNQLGNNGNSLEGIFRHTSKKKSISVKFTVDATGTKAFFFVKNSPGIKIEPYDSSISLPNNITLTKVANEIVRKPRE